MDSGPCDFGATVRGEMPGLWTPEPAVLQHDLTLAGGGAVHSITSRLHSTASQRPPAGSTADQYNRPAGAADGADGRPAAPGVFPPNPEELPRISGCFITSGLDDGAVLAWFTWPLQFLPFLSHENPQVLPSPQDTLHP